MFLFLKNIVLNGIVEYYIGGGIIMDFKRYQTLYNSILP